MFEPKEQFESRRKYCRAMFKKYGHWQCIRMHPETKHDVRDKALSWCQTLQHAWGVHSGGRRFYFASPDEALMFKLANGGI